MTQVSTPQSGPHTSVKEITLADLLRAMAREKRVIAGTALLAAAAGLGLALVLPPTFTARTMLLPPQQGQNASAALGASLGALAAATGVVAGIKAPDELYVGLLKTDTVANALVERFKLRDRYDEETLIGTRRELARKSRIASDRKSSLISVEVDDTDPAFAAQLANAYPEELRKLLDRLAITDAQQRRAFFEQQMARAKDDLAKAELAVRRGQESGGLVSVDAQTQAMIGAAAQIRGQIVARQVQLQALRPYAGPQNPELQRLTSELASLQSQLNRMENGADPGRGAADSQAALGNVRAYRELRYQEAIYAGLLQQFQLARAEEAREAPLLQQVDVALPPDRKSGPRKALFVAGGAAAGLVAGLLIAFMRRRRRRVQAGAFMAADGGGAEA